MGASDTDINLRGPNRTLSGCEDGEFDRRTCIERNPLPPFSLMPNPPVYIDIDDKYIEDRFLRAKFMSLPVVPMLFTFGAMALVQPQVELNALEMTLPESQRRKLLIRFRQLELKWAVKNTYGLLFQSMVFFFCYLCYYVFLFKSS